MKEAILTILRDKTTQPHRFRAASDKLALLLASEISREIAQVTPLSIETPLISMEGCKIASQVVLIPILRSGIALLNSIIMIFEEAKVGFFGIKRDEKTAKPSLYYHNLPPFSAKEQILILDPMIATGGSALLAIHHLLEQGANLSQLYLVGVIGSQEGLATIRAQFPNLRIKLVAEDPQLNAQKFIVPGLGDFGDRYFHSL